MLPNPQFPADVITFTEEIFNGKFHFLFSDVQEKWEEIIIPKHLFKHV